MLVMNSAEKLKCDVILKLTQNKINRRQAQQILGKSESTIRRYLRKYEKQGIGFVKHGNYRKKPVRRISDEIKNQVYELVRTKYYDLNCTHLQEKLAQTEGFAISRQTLNRWLHEWKFGKKRRRRKKYKARFHRDRSPQRGIMLQMDGSHHDWFGGKRSVLIACIDDATNEIPWAEFFPSEDTFSCMKVLKEILKRYGRPQVLYTDRAGIFNGPKRQDFSQFTRACEELGMDVFYAQTPQAKGRVERLFRTLQDRLIPEMRLKNIQSMKMANWFLLQDFLPKVFQKRFTVQAQDPQEAFEPLDELINLNEIFCIKEQRIINNDHTIRYNNQVYALKLPFKKSIAHQAVEVRQYPDMTFNAYWRNIRLRLKPVKNYSRPGF